MVVMVVMVAMVEGMLLSHGHVCRYVCSPYLCILSPTTRNANHPKQASTTYSAFGLGRDVSVFSHILHILYFNCHYIYKFRIHILLYKLAFSTVHIANCSVGLRLFIQYGKAYSPHKLSNDLEYKCLNPPHP